MIARKSHKSLKCEQPLLHCLQIKLGNLVFRTYCFVIFVRILKRPKIFGSLVMYTYLVKNPFTCNFPSLLRESTSSFCKLAVFITANGSPRLKQQASKLHIMYNLPPPPPPKKKLLVRNLRCGSNCLGGK